MISYSIARFVKEGHPDPLQNVSVYFPYSFHNILIHQNETYAYALQRFWALRPYQGILVLEHDIVVSSDTFSLLDIVIQYFPNYIIGVPYFLNPSTTLLKHSVLAHRRDLSIPFPMQWNSHHLASPIQRLESFGLGCTYLPLSVLPLINPNWDYPLFDSQLSEVVYPHIPAFSPMSLLAVHLH